MSRLALAGLETTTLRLGVRRAYHSAIATRLFVKLMELDYFLACEDRWVMNAGMGTVGGQFQEAASVQECMDLCLADPECAAVDVSSQVPFFCFLHSDTDMVSNDNYTSELISQYVLMERCPRSTYSVTRLKYSHKFIGCAQYIGIFETFIPVWVVTCRYTFSALSQYGTLGPYFPNVFYNSIPEWIVRCTCILINFLLKFYPSMGL